MRYFVLTALLAVEPLTAEVTAADEGGFTLVVEEIIEAPRAKVWRAAVGGVGQWWSSSHTISGDAANMSIAAEPLGCFCERLPGGGAAAHLSVTFVNPGVLLRMTGGLGPLGLMGVNGNMTWEFDDADGATRVRFAYAVGGYHPKGLDALAAPVDAVIGEALQRLKAHVEGGTAGGSDAN